MVLFEQWGSQSHRSKRLLPIFGNGSNSSVDHIKTVGVSGGDVKRKIAVESVLVVVEIELGQRGIGYCDFELTRI